MSDKYDKILVVAFDGLDYQYIKKFDCRSIMQENFGKIDLSNWDDLPSPELWTSFITGEMPEDHGIKFFKRWNSKGLQRLEERLNKYRFFQKWRGFRIALLKSIESFDFKRITPKRDDIEVETIFDEIPGAYSLNIPIYDRNLFIQRITWQIERSLGSNADIPKETVLRSINAEHMKRKQELFEMLQEEYSLLITHFHKTDSYQHIFWDEERLEELYTEMDELAAEIKEKSDADLIIFLSDHGLEKGEHRKEAFYSTSEEIELDNPNLTDFYEFLKKKVRYEEKILDLEV